MKTCLVLDLSETKLPDESPATREFPFVKKMKKKKKYKVHLTIIIILHNYNTTKVCLAGFFKIL